MEDMGMMMMMPSYFEFKTHVTILFKQWKTTSAGGLVGSCIAICVLAVLYEGLKVAREKVKARNTLAYTRHECDQQGHLQPTQIAFRNNCVNLNHALQSVWHMLQVFIAYLLMLTAMTYNGWLFLSVIMGSGLGYFLFAWQQFPSKVEEEIYEPI